MNTPRATELNFFIIGAAKAGTTSLSSLLGTHPEIGIPQSKEIHFFSFDHVYSLGWEHYTRLFEHFSDRSAIGDASTSYSRIRYHPSTVERIYRQIPDAKIIYMVRNPLQRIESAYIEHLCTPESPVFPSVNEAVAALPMIVDSSRYWEVYDAYRQRFDEGKIQVVWFEVYLVNKVAVLRDLYQFLNVSNGAVPNLKMEDTDSRKAAPWRMALLGRGNVPIDTRWNEATKQAVLEQIRDDNFRFLSHFGKPTDYWDNMY